MEVSRHIGWLFRLSPPSRALYAPQSLRRGTDLFRRSFSSAHLPKAIAGPGWIVQGGTSRPCRVISSSVTIFELPALYHPSPARQNQGQVTSSPHPTPFAFCARPSHLSHCDMLHPLPARLRPSSLKDNHFSHLFHFPRKVWRKNTLESSENRTTDQVGHYGHGSD